MNLGTLTSWAVNLYSGRGKSEDLCCPFTVDGLMIDLVIVVGRHTNRLKSLFVHKMQNIRGHAPIVEVLEAAGVHVRAKVKKVRGSESSTTPSPTTPTSKVLDICGSAPKPFAISLPTTIATSITSTTTSISFDRGDGNSGLAWVAESRTPTITDRTEWMVHRTESLTRIKQKKEARRRGASFADS